MHLYFLLWTVFLSISLAAPKLNLGIKTIDDDFQPLEDDAQSPQVVEETLAYQNFPISDDTLITKSGNLPPINDDLTPGDLTTSERLLNPATTEPDNVLDMPQNIIYPQDDAVQIAKIAPLSEPLYSSCDDLWSQKCTICRSNKEIALVCAAAEKVTRKEAGDTLCVQGSTEKCVPFNSIANDYSNNVVTKWDITDVKRIWSTPSTHLPENPGKISGFCREIDVGTDCKICTREERSDCTPSHVEKNSGVSQVCNNKDGCTRYED